jgi:hypothetical protein
MASTRKVLERVAEDKLDWRAHPKSNTIGWNANHLAEILGWVEGERFRDYLGLLARLQLDPRWHGRAESSAKPLGILDCHRISKDMSSLPRI